MSAIASSTRIVETLGSFALQAVQSAADTLRALSRGISNRAAIRQLAEADDHMLRDIGLTRSDVTAALRVPPLSDPVAHIRAFSER